MKFHQLKKLCYLPLQNSEAWLILPLHLRTDCNPKLGHINFWVSLIREVGGWLVEPFAFVMAAFTVLPNGKLG